MPRVLFVDDEQHLLAGLRRLLGLRMPHIEFATANSVDEALLVLSEAEADVVVSDVLMPGRDGFDLLQAIVSDELLSDIPVVMLTGELDDALKRRALDLGATDLLTKPVQQEDLVARIQNALRTRESIRRIRSQAEALRLAHEVAASRLDVIWCLARAAEQRDGVTGRHVIRVGAYSWLIACELGLDAEFAEMLALASPLHDVGKIGTPDAVLGKGSALTDEEWGVMKQHCVIGAEILNPDTRSTPLLAVWEKASGRRTAAGELPQNTFLRMAASIALTHHERWDGEGYPLRLAGEAIPLESRIVAVADVYDALLSERPYKPAYPETRVLKMMKANVGQHYDPAVYDAFESVLPRIHEVYRELLDQTVPMLVA